MFKLAGLIALADRALSLLPFNGQKTKVGLALKGIIMLFPGLGAFISSDMVDALDNLANALIALGASHGIIKSSK